MHGVVWERQCLNVAFQLTHDVDVHTLCYEVLPKLYSCLPRFTLHLQPHHPSLFNLDRAVLRQPRQASPAGYVPSF